MKTEYDKNETPGPSNFAKKTSWNTAIKFKVTKFNGSYFKVANISIEYLLLKYPMVNFQIPLKCLIPPTQSWMYVPMLYVPSYMFETCKFKNKNYDDMFLSWATIKPVTRVSHTR